ncbi:membrane-spanning 4-domains subfamily A member 4A-like [Epinephelus lanceolatus]
MEGTESKTRERTTTGNDGNQAAVNMELMSGKPLHRFVRNEPRSLGIVMLVFGCAELLMGFPLAKQNMTTSWTIYIPLWQGALFLVCGNLSIYTEIHPSKKMVTVSLAMYVVTLLGVFVSVGFRIYSLVEYSAFYSRSWYRDKDVIYQMLLGIESVLLTSSLCVLVLLIFLSTIARLALKSTHSQVIFQHIPTPRSDKT